MNLSFVFTVGIVDVVSIDIIHFGLILCHDNARVSRAQTGAQAVKLISM